MTATAKGQMEWEPFLCWGTSLAWGLGTREALRAEQGFAKGCAKGCATCTQDRWARIPQHGLKIQLVFLPQLCPAEFSAWPGHVPLGHSSGTRRGWGWGWAQPVVPSLPTRCVCSTMAPPSPWRAVPARAQTVPFREISEQTWLCPCHTRVGESVVSGTGAVPTWDLPWSWSVPGLSRIWTLFSIASLAWGPHASQVMCGSQCGCSAPLFLYTPWGNQTPRGQG